MNTPEPSAESPDLDVDRGGVVMILALAVVVAPATILASAWLLTSGFDFAGASPFELVVAGLSCLLALYVIFVAARELRGGLGVDMDDEGIRLGQITLRWDEVEQLEAPAFGILDISGAGKQLRLRTYLYRDRKAVLEYVARRTGKQVPEMGYSY